MKKKGLLIICSLLIISIFINIFLLYKLNNKDYSIYRFDILSEKLKVSNITLITGKNRVTILDNYEIQKMVETDDISNIYLNISSKNKNIIDSSLSNPFEGRDIIYGDTSVSNENLSLNTKDVITIKLEYKCKNIPYKEIINLKLEDLKKIK
jgi:hypothetical protein